jgi:hypothetical protein
MGYPYTGYLRLQRHRTCVHSSTSINYIRACSEVQDVLFAFTFASRSGLRISDQGGCGGAKIHHRTHGHKFRGCCAHVPAVCESETR